MSMIAIWIGRVNNLEQRFSIAIIIEQVYNYEHFRLTTSARTLSP